MKAFINGIEVEVNQGTTILDAAKKVNINIPVLCKHPDIDPSAACGICIVKNEGSEKMLRACCTPIEAGMKIITHDSQLQSIRRTTLELILSNHPNDCLQCARNNNCELQKLAAEFGIREVPFPNFLKGLKEDLSTKTINLVPDKCILCGRCVHVCQDLQDVWALSFLERGIKTRISPAGDINLSESPCIRCGQCSAHCPTGAIAEYDQTEKAWQALYDKDKYCVVQIAPAVRVAIGEAFGYEPGTNLTKKLYSALRRLGFRAVFDTSFGADLTIMEEASEFAQRFIHRKGKLPLITTCCPSWVDFMEKFYPDMIENFSSAKSPHEMVGVLSKTYYAEKKKINPKDIVMISVMPCTSKKYEITRSDEMYSSGSQDVDIVLTTREIARMIKQAGIDFENLKDQEPYNILGSYTGAGVIFGATGGVMEAALRTAYHSITGNNFSSLEFQGVRGLVGVKEASIDLAGKKLRVAIAHGMGNVESVLEKIRKASGKEEEMPYHFIEVMACYGGCVGGGGQPYGVTDKLRGQRASGLYRDDQENKIHYSHENPYIKKLYKDFLEKPLSDKSHKLLHTRYKPRPLYRK